jgi:hypothetical protein
MDRYGIAIGKEPDSGLKSVDERMSRESETFCEFCGHGKVFCDKKIELNETITRGTLKMTWSAAWCTREWGHKGSHIACSSTAREHCIKIWD